MMENSDEFVCSNDQIMIKGKRTKRQRAASPCGGKGDHSSSIYSSSPTTSSTHDMVYDSTDQEDEDMAKCLILLAQGDGAARMVEKDSDVKVERFGGGSSKRFIEAVRNSSGKAGFYVYECKTCNRTFPSFQALGGHRASHKKPKMMMNLVEDKKIQELVSPTKDEIVLDKILHPRPSACPPPVSLQMDSKSSVQLLQSTNKASKTHECSICGAEFTSGQALGGHMRRHRAAAPPPPPSTRATAQISMSTSTTSSGLPEEADEKPRNILALDLNLPAPEEIDQRDTKFQFVTPPRSLVLSSPTLVGCHY